jgi:hypothetical protein
MDVHHEQLGLRTVVVEVLHEDVGHVRHEVDRVVPDDGDPRPLRLLEELGAHDLGWGYGHAAILP